MSTEPTLLDVALSYHRRGWSPIPVHFKSKKPNNRAWPELRLTEADIHKEFHRKQRNIGVLLGEPSQELIDIDLDHPFCVELADQFLPPTPAVFGRPGKPRSHRLYRVVEPLETKSFPSKSEGMLVEVRSTGRQTVFPPSIHESGEPITWETEGAEPALVTAEQLLTAVEALVKEAKRKLGESVGRDASAKRTPTKRARILGSEVDSNAVAKCVRAMRRMKMEDHKDGSRRLFAACCRVVEHGLTDAEGIVAVRQFATERPFPTIWTDKQILDRIRDAEKEIQRGPQKKHQIVQGTVDKNRPKVFIDTNESRVVDETIAALTADPDLYCRGNHLVRLSRVNSLVNGEAHSYTTATITPIPPANLRERIAKYAKLTTVGKRGNEVPAHPRDWVVKAVHARGEWPGIRELHGVSDVPLLRHDGSVHQVPGYDPVTRFLFEPTTESPLIPTNANQDDAHNALSELLEIVQDFRFENDAHRAAWLAALLTLLARPAFAGPAPLFLIDANIRGAGKSLLAQTVAVIVQGHGISASSYAHDPEEMRKKITTTAMSGDRLVLLDNIECHLGNDALNRALTTTRWKDRLLGTNQQVDLPLEAVWLATGNNVIVAGDLIRRTIHVRLDVLDDRPEERIGFAHPNLLEWIRQNRPRLLKAAMTILVAYCNAGRPKQSLTSFGSFEGWSELVREAVVWVGLPDPCDTRKMLAESADSDAESFGQLIQAWQQYDPNNVGIVVSDLLAKLYPNEDPPRDEASAAMRAALEALAGCAPGKAPTSRQVGNRLKKSRRRPIGGLYLDTNPKEGHRKGAAWRLYGLDKGVLGCRP